MNANWLVVAVALLGLVLAWIAGRQGAEAVLNSETMVAELGPKVVATPEFADSLERTDSTGAILENRIMELLEDETVAQNIVAQASVASELDASIARSLYEGAGKDAINAAVALAMRNITPAVQPQAAAPKESAEVDRLRRVMQGYERRLATLAVEVQDDESATIVNGLQGQLFEMQGLLAGLSQEVRCVVARGGSGTRSFLLKERRSTPLSGVNLLVSLGRLRKGVLKTVSISSYNPNASAGQASATTAVKANVSIGRPFNFEANGRSYEGTFTYSQGRWGPDFVGFEMHDIGTIGSTAPDC